MEYTREQIMQGDHLDKNSLTVRALFLEKHEKSIGQGVPLMLSDYKRKDQEEIQEFKVNRDKIAGDPNYFLSPKHKLYQTQ